MEKTAFVATEWVRQAQATTDISQSRTDIGKYFGWSDDWFADDLTLGLLFDFLQLQAPGLLIDVELADDDASRQTWIARVAEASRYGDASWDDNYGLYCRYDKLTELYEWADSASPEGWMTQEEADELVRSLADSQDEGPEGGPDDGPHDALGAPSPEADAGYSQAAWDDNWKMLYRTDKNGIYQYARSEDQQTVQPGASWLTYDQLKEDRAARAQRHTSEALAVLAPGNLPALAAELDIDEALLSELISELPDDFELMVHAEVVALDDADD